MARAYVRARAYLPGDPTELRSLIVLRAAFVVGLDRSPASFIYVQNTYGRMSNIEAKNDRKYKTS